MVFDVMEIGLFRNQFWKSGQNNLSNKCLSCPGTEPLLIGAVCSVVRQVLYQAKRFDTIPTTSTLFIVLIGRITQNLPV